MLVNILFLLVIAGAAVLFGWLTFRAIRAGRLWVKVAGGIGAGLLTLVCAAVAVFGAVSLVKMNAATALPVPDLKVAGTPEQIARGKYIAGIGCAGCHGVDERFPLTGGRDMAGEIPMPIGALIAPNITPGGILHDRTDGELFRAIRQGFGKDGHLLTFMSQLGYRHLSDDDIQAVIAFLRSQEAVASSGPSGDRLNLLGAILFYGTGMLPQPAPIAGTISAPPVGMTAEYGSYAATVADCRGCHGPQMTGVAASAMSGPVPNPRPIVAGWTQEQFIQTLRTGARPDGSRLGPGMPWQAAAQLTDADLAALYTYLKAPVQ